MDWFVKSQKDWFVKSKNILDFADQLVTEVNPSRRATLMRLMVHEEDRFGRGTYQLDLVARRLLTGHMLIEEQKARIARLALDGEDIRRGNLLLTQLLEVQALFEAYRLRIVDELNKRSSSNLVKAKRHNRTIPNTRTDRGTAHRQARASR